VHDGTEEIHLDNPAFYNIRYLARCWICLAGYLAGYQILKMAGYLANDTNIIVQKFFKRYF
jgi:hypothetical protein